MKKIKILIADDHLLVRTGIISLLEDVPDIEIIGEAEDGRNIIEKSKKLKPDIILMDISMPEVSGIEATLQIKEVNPSIQILILTMHENEEYIFSSIKHGASGILHKNVSKEELITAIRTLASGKRYFGSSVSQLMIESLLQKVDDNNMSHSKEKIFLTKREKEVLYLVANGLSNQEIAVRLEISARTVDTHKTNLMQKLNIKTTAALARYAFENNLK
jgi:two-component system response regulator NreC